MALGLPNINITFQSLGNTAIQRNERGVVALVLEQAGVTGRVVEVYNATDIPEDFSATNRDLVELALVGGELAPKKVLVALVPASGLVTGLTLLQPLEFNWIATPYATLSDYQSLVTWVGDQRTNGKKIKCVVANHSANKEYVINFTTTDIVADGVTYTPEKFTCRIVGLLAGTPLTISATYYPLSDVTSTRSYTKTQLDTAIANGEFVIFHDGRKVKVARSITSHTTVTVNKPESFKKIKVVSITDLMETDIKNTLEDNYIGKYPNTYDNKMLIVSAIRGYLDQLEREPLLDDAYVNTCDVDVDAQKNYLKSIGVDVTKMKENELRAANTGDKAFFYINAQILDAIEDISIAVNI